MDFEAIGDVHVLQHAPHGGMLDVLIGSGMLDTRVRDAGAMVEKRRQVPATDVTIFIDRRGEHRAAVVSKPCRVVRAAAEKRDAKGSSADNHAAVPFRTALASYVCILPRLEDRVAFHQ